MIHRIYSDLPKFKDLAFSSGLNVLLADTVPGATERQTRNRAGKTSLVEIVHFLLGSNADPDSLFRTPALINATFGIDVDLGLERVVVERSGRNPSKLSVQGGTAVDWPASPAVSRKDGQRMISNSKWRVVLGELWFRFNQETLRESLGLYTPTFRSLFSYFARRELTGGFIEPVTQSRRQLTWDWQVAISFLLGLDWTIPQQLQQVRDRESALQEFRAAAKAGAFGAMLSSTAELRTQVTVAEDRVERLRASLSEFRVLPEYRDLEQEASTLTRRLSELADSNTLDRQLLAELEEAIQSEEPPSVANLFDLYEEAEVHLSDAVRARFSDVEAFHESIIRNRRIYLEGEIQAIQEAINRRHGEMAQVDRRRGEIMGILQTHGALDSYFALQGELGKAEAQAESLRQRFVAAEQLEGLKNELEIDRRNLSRRLQQDYREQADALKRAILTFEGISRELYEEAGHLTISESTNGPQFNVTIQGERSKGVTNMQIFCFDMMLMRIMMERGMGPGFLIHDSHLFDGVDERQKAHALKIGRDLAEQHGFQYIVTMNSDEVPGWFPPGFEFDRYVLPVKLTDETEEGGLFGMRFG